MDAKPYPGFAPPPSMRPLGFGVAGAWVAGEGHRGRNRCDRLATTWCSKPFLCVEAPPPLPPAGASAAGGGAVGIGTKSVAASLETREIAATAADAASNGNLLAAMPMPSNEDAVVLVYSPPPIAVLKSGSVSELCAVALNNPAASPPVAGDAAAAKTPSSSATPASATPAAAAAAEQKTLEVARRSTVGAVNELVIGQGRAGSDNIVVVTRQDDWCSLYTLELSDLYTNKYSTNKPNRGKWAELGPPIHFPAPVSAISFGTRLPGGTVAACCEDGSVWSWPAGQLRPGTPLGMLGGGSSSSNRSVACHFGPHPQTVLAWTSRHARLYDARAPGRTAPALLSVAGNIAALKPFDRFTAAANNPDNPFESVAFTESTVCLYDLRRASTPLLQWERHQKGAAQAAVFVSVAGRSGSIAAAESSRSFKGESVLYRSTTSGATAPPFAAGPAASLQAWDVGSETRHWKETSFTNTAGTAILLGAAGRNDSGGASNSMPPAAVFRLSSLGAVTAQVLRSKAPTPGIRYAEAAGDNDADDTNEIFLEKAATTPAVWRTASAFAVEAGATAKSAAAAKEAEVKDLTLLYKYMFDSTRSGMHFDESQVVKRIVAAVNGGASYNDARNVVSTGALLNKRCSKWILEIVAKRGPTSVEELLSLCYEEQPLHFSLYDFELAVARTPGLTLQVIATGGAAAAAACLIVSKVDVALQAAAVGIEPEEETKEDDAEDRDEPPLMARLKTLWDDPLARNDAKLTEQRDRFDGGSVSATSRSRTENSTIFRRAARLPPLPRVHGGARRASTAGVGARAGAGAGAGATGATGATGAGAGVGEGALSSQLPRFSSVRQTTESASPRRNANPGTKKRRKKGF